MLSIGETFSQATLCQPLDDQFTQVKLSFSNNWLSEEFAPNAYSQVMLLSQETVLFWGQMVSTQELW